MAIVVRLSEAAGLMNDPLDGRPVEPGMATLESNRQAKHHREEERRTPMTSARGKGS
jgi:hypothetical protein